MISEYWSLIATDIGFTGSVTAAIIVFTLALARKETHPAASTSDQGNTDSLRKAS